MSFLGRSGGASSSGVNPERVEMAMQELDMITDVFNRLVSSVTLSLRRSLNDQIIICIGHVTQNASAHDTQKET
ncbi:protein transporter tim10, variant 3 [Taiwanofungus camphoratus]|nr:protein transporter tim10, variant 2 [Antrodia cinnamomea]KAI0963287.1 protein transporter tim10, variant 3 [Antrodia cinnamomea]